MAGASLLSSRQQTPATATACMHAPRGGSGSGSALTVWTLERVTHIGRFPDGDCPSPALSAPEEIRSRSRSLCPPRGAAAASRHGAVAVCVTRGRVPPALIVDGSFFFFSFCNLVMQFRLESILFEL